MTDELETNGLDLGVLLRRARRLKRWSQRDLADQAGVPARTVERIESGAVGDPRIRTVAALFAALGCRLSIVSWVDSELPEHPWEEERDNAGRHLPAHVELRPVPPRHEFLEPWHGWLRPWASRPDARIPKLTFSLLRNDWYAPPVDPVTGVLDDPHAEERARLAARREARRAAHRAWIAGHQAAARARDADVELDWEQ